ncbi:hypothetical protein HYS91_05895, partial [Candidatus Daviesbacteria bacterium]|nr:hypothetical protein [Candidatus Daviesbacteria bacterium]
METLKGNPQSESLSNPPDIFNTQLSRRGFFKLLGSRAAAGVAGYMAQRLGLLPLLSAEGPPEPERVFNNIEVITMSGNASGDRLACVFRDPLDST